MIEKNGFYRLKVLLLSFRHSLSLLHLNFFSARLSTQVKALKKCNDHVQKMKESIK
jgi:hypothetical protein